jgi:alpha-mannosidase
MLESARVLKDLPGLPKVQTGKVEPYFERLHEHLKDKNVPVWDGELYLELHRGTYTSQAQNKRANRKAEILYHDAEWLAALAGIYLGEQASIDLSEGWEMLLLNQFHDILPGSSIRQVYEDSAKDYERITEIGAAALTEALWQVSASIRSEQGSLVVFNSLSQPRNVLVALPYDEDFANKAFMLGVGQVLPTQTIEQDVARAILLEVPQVPAYGYTTIPVTPVTQPLPDEQNQLTVERHLLENPLYRIEVDERGRLASIYDKLAQREVLAPGAVGNILQAFEDKPLNADAWDIDLFYQEKVLEVSDLIEAVVEETGPLRGTLRLRWHFYNSTITQRISIYRAAPRIDFRTEVDWHEQQVLLKVAFPVNIRATSATYDIQFGSIQRPTHWNTSWDWARFEVPAQKWADLSEGNYGVALLNDCKYGYDIHDNVMRLTLIKSAIRPDAQADQGQHVFTYSLLPHTGSCYDGGVIEEGYSLNYPAHTNFIPAQSEGTLPLQASLLSVEGSSVIVETVKRAEDGDGWIVRVYEAKHERHNIVTVRFSLPIRRAVECSLIEESASPVDFEGSTLTFPIAPFEIKTFRVWF